MRRSHRFSTVIALAHRLALCSLLGPALASAQATNDVVGEVWLDSDRDGIRSPGEPGVAQVAVALLDAYGRLTGASTVTDAAGRYAFGGLADGAYRVAFDAPAGRRFTRSDVGSLGPGGVRIGPGARGDDSDLNLVHGYRDPGRRGPHATGMRYVELTRFDALGRPWPINVWAVYPAAAGAPAGPKARIRDLYLGDLADMQNNVASSKLATQLTGGNSNEILPADPDRTVQDIEARIGAPASPDGPFPVVSVCSGLLGSAADMVEIGDQLASHGYVALCFETTAFHTSVALGARLATSGGAFVRSDFAHIPEVGGAQLAALVGWGYQGAEYLTAPFSGNPTLQEDVLKSDAGFALDQAALWNVTPGHPLAGAFDLTRVGWYGYSMGARRAGPAVRDDDRIAFLINVDSGAYVDVAKPAMWVGNSGFQTPTGPSIQARLQPDFHPHYFSIPAILFDPVGANGIYHREFHQDFRNTLITAFCGYYLQDALGYREDLGLDGRKPTFDGYVAPYVTTGFPGPQSPPVSVSAGSRAEVDAGLVEARLWAIEGNRLSATTMDFLPLGTLAGAARVDFGSIRALQMGVPLPLAAPAQGLALDAERHAWFVAGAPVQLYRIDLAAVEGGALVFAEDLGPITGLPLPVHALTFEPRGSRLVALAGAPVRLFGFAAEVGARAHDLGAPAGALAPTGVDVDRRGRVLVTDFATGSVRRTSLATAQDLGALGALGIHPLRAAFDDVSGRLFVVDRASATLASFDPETGAVALHGSLAALGFAGVPALGFERITASLSRPSLLGQLAATAPGPQPVLAGARVFNAAQNWAGALLRVQISEGTGVPADRLTLEPSSAITLGPAIEVDLPRLLIGQAREVHWHGRHVAWLEEDWGLAIGGTRLAPLRIAFTSAADAGAVAAIIASLRYHGPLPRRIELQLQGPDGERSLPEVVELR